MIAIICSALPLPRRVTFSVCMAYCSIGAVARTAPSPLFAIRPPTCNHRLSSSCLSAHRPRWALSPGLGGDRRARCRGGAPRAGQNFSIVGGSGVFDGTLSPFDGLDAGARRWRGDFSPGGSSSLSSSPAGQNDDQDSIGNHQDGDDDSGGGGGEYYQPEFRRGDMIQVEVISFGPLGASVDVVAHGSHDTDRCISSDEPAMGVGMILQREIAYFRRGRDNVDVVQYEVLPAYVENVREPDGRLDVSLRPPGGRAKAEELGSAILQKLKEAEDGTLPVGDKSSPGEIDQLFPGMSKASFKKAVSSLYKNGVVTPSKYSISLMS